MQDGALILAGAPARIPISMQVGLVLLEHAEGRLSIYLKDHDHEGTH